MCTNRALVDSLECYMDDLVDCFEDFVKKSLILISVGVGTVVVMLVYMLRVLSNRTGTSDAVLAAEPRGQPIQRVRSDTSIPSSGSKGSTKRNNIKSNYMLSCNPKLASTSANTLPMPTVPSFDERLLRDIGFSNCHKTCELKARPSVCKSPSRITIPSLPTCLSKQHLSKARKCEVKVLNRTSCCSMCCADDKSNSIG